MRRRVAAAAVVRCAAGFRAVGLRAVAFLAAGFRAAPPDAALRAVPWVAAPPWPVAFLRVAALAGVALRADAVLRAGALPAADLRAAGLAGAAARRAVARGAAAFRAGSALLAGRRFAAAAPVPVLRAPAAFFATSAGWPENCLPLAASRRFFAVVRAYSSSDSLSRALRGR